MIIDTRSEEIFKKGSIPNAKNLTQADVMEKVDLSAYPSGIYFVELSVDGHSSTKKLVKN